MFSYRLRFQGTAARCVNHIAPIITGAMALNFILSHQDLIEKIIHSFRASFGHYDSKITYMFLKFFI